MTRRYRRRPGPVASVFWLLFACCFVVAAFQTPGQWWLGVVVATVLVLGVIGAVSKSRARQATATSPALSPRQEAERQSLLRRIDAMRSDLGRLRYRSRCDHCGAPNKGHDLCPYCGSALGTRREIGAASERLS